MDRGFSFANAAIGEDLKHDVLGSRNKLLFVEGVSGSLDAPLYHLLFPEASVIGKNGCREVEQAVLGTRSAQDMHWIKAFGIVDNDRRSAVEISKLKRNGIYALAVYSAEAIYYNSEMMRILADRQANITGADAADSFNNALSSALESVRPHVIRLASRTAEKKVREQMYAAMPRFQDLAAKPEIKLAIDVKPFLRTRSNV